MVLALALAAWARTHGPWALYLPLGRERFMWEFLSLLRGLSCLRALPLDHLLAMSLSKYSGSRFRVDAKLPLLSEGQMLTSNVSSEEVVRQFETLSTRLVLTLGPAAAQPCHIYGPFHVLSYCYVLLPLLPTSLLKGSCKHRLGAKRSCICGPDNGR